MGLVYDWEKFYEAAVLETDFRKMPVCVAEARRAIRQRLAEAPLSGVDATELNAIDNALAGLLALENDARESSRTASKSLD